MGLLDAVRPGRFGPVRRVFESVVDRGWTFARTYGAIGPDHPAARRFGSFGPGTMVGFPQATLNGSEAIHVGANTLVGGWVTLSAGYLQQQHPVGTKILEIGDRCWIGMRCSLVAHESIVIEDDVWFGPDVFVTDANHGMADLDVPIGQQLGKHLPVVIGAGSWIGRGATILPGVQVGKNAVVAAGAVVAADVPDFGIVAGVPARLIRCRDEG